MADMPWQTYAACIGADTELFYPARGESCTEAKLICHKCPVQRECLTYALVCYEKHGVWGGKSERERRILRRRIPRHINIQIQWTAARQLVRRVLPHANQPNRT